MIKNLEITLYEIFGYLLPGIIVLLAILFLYWTLFFPAQAVLDVQSPEVWIGGLALAYIAGHMAQAIGNLMQKRIKSSESLVLGKDGEMPGDLVKAIREKATKTFGFNTDNLPEQWLYRVCDDAVIRSGKVGERDLYIYREGFYRGTSIALAAMTIGSMTLMMRLCTVETQQMTLLRVGILATPWRLLFVAVIAGLWTWLCFNRYRRFAAYRISHSVLGFLTVKDIEGQSDKK